MSAAQKIGQEVWHQDAADPDLWLGQHGLIVNTAALTERRSFFEVATRFKPRALKRRLAEGKGHDRDERGTRVHP